MPENSREPAGRKAPMPIPFSTTFKNQSPPTLRVSVNRLVIIFVFYVTQSALVPEEYTNHVFLSSVSLSSTVPSNTQSMY